MRGSSTAGSTSSTVATSTARPAPPTGPGGPATSTAEAQPSSSAATAPAPARPSRWGRPRTPAARSSARSGSTLAKCAPVPSSTAAAVSHGGGHGPPGRPSVTKAGSRPKASAYGAQESTVRFSPRLYAHPAATPARCAAPAAAPAANDSGTQTSSAAPAAARSTAGSNSPAASGLSRRRAARSRRWSIRSLLHPTESWPAATAAPVSAQPAGPRPHPAANAVANSVTAAAGAGWQARSSGSGRTARPAAGTAFTFGMPRC